MAGNTWMRLEDWIAVSGGRHEESDAQQLNRKSSKL